MASFAIYWAIKLSCCRAVQAGKIRFCLSLYSATPLENTMPSHCSSFASKHCCTNTASASATDNICGGDARACFAVRLPGARVKLAPDKSTQRMQCRAMSFQSVGEACLYTTSDHEGISSRPQVLACFLHDELPTCLCLKGQLSLWVWGCYSKPLEGLLAADCSFALTFDSNGPSM